MNFYFIDDLIRLLKQIPLLQDADVNSAYAAPTMSRPVLRKTVSVGLQSAESTPASRTTYQAQAEVFLSLLFPCGMGPSSLSDCVEDICQKFTGQILQNYLIARITVGRAKFDSTAYAIRAEMVFHLTGRFEPAVNNQDPPTRVSFGKYTFDETPDEILLEQEVEGLQEDGTLPLDRSVPVTVTLRGDCMHDADSTFCQNLQWIYAAEKAAAHAALSRRVRNGAGAPVHQKQRGRLRILL